MNEVAGTGNWNTAQYWEFPTRTGTRPNRDPKLNPSISPYATFSGNPIWHSDVLGDSAWAITQQWDAKTMDKFTKDAPNIVKGLQKGGKKYTCDDLALETVMTFAKENGLPFKWETGSGTFDAASDKYKDYSTFSHDVLSKSGAPDFQRGGNAFPSSLNSMRSGSIVLNDHRSTGKAHHVQVVVGVVSSQSTHLQPSQVLGLIIKQGNFNKLGRYLGSDDPNSSRYLGVPIQTGLYDAVHDAFTNFSRGEGAQRNFSFDNDNALEFRKFNFLNWNK